MIYFISDIHGDIAFPGLKQYIEAATDDDLLIILGDTELNFQKTEENEKFTEWFLSINKKIIMIDGNHENFEYLNSFPEEEMYGGKVRRLTGNIILLERGNIYNIDGKSFFVFGGCKSSPKWKELGLWYPGEEPSKDELKRAHANLEKCNYTVDYVLTHKYEVTPGKGTVCAELQKLVAFINENVNYKKWFVGHGHREFDIDAKHMMVYDRPVALND